MKKWLSEASAFCGHSRNSNKDENEAKGAEICGQLDQRDPNADSLNMGLSHSCHSSESRQQTSRPEPCELTSQQHESSSNCQAALSFITSFGDGNLSSACSSPSLSSHYSLNGHACNLTDSTSISTCPCPTLHTNSEKFSLKVPSEHVLQSPRNAPIYQVELEQLSSPISSQPLHSNDIIESDNESQNAISVNPSDWYRVNWSSNPIYGDGLSASSGASRLHTTRDHSDIHVSSGLRSCGHLCTTCQVKVQVEVECVSNIQRPPSNECKRGIKNLSFSKRSRHKAKASSKETNSSSKRKKTSWGMPFLKGVRRHVKMAGDPSTSNCSSCSVHSGQSIRQNDLHPNLNQLNNHIDFSCAKSGSDLDSEMFPLGEMGEVSRVDVSNRNPSGVVAPPGFASIINSNTNSVALSLTYNSVLDLRDLLDRSLRLGLGGPREESALHIRDRVLGQIGHLVNEIPRSVHTQVDYVHCLVPDLLSITNCAFYWGKMDRYEAERLLESRPEGTFLLRDSAQEEHLFSVSFRRYGRSLHARIEQFNHKFSFDSHDPGVFATNTVCGLIEHYKDPSCCMFFEPLLTNPLSRTFPFPLQHLCRAAICSRVSYDGIGKLPSPKKLMTYLKEYHYKQRVRVRHLD